MINSLRSESWKHPLVWKHWEICLWTLTEVIPSQCPTSRDLKLCSSVEHKWLPMKLQKYLLCRRKEIYFGEGIRQGKARQICTRWISYIWLSCKRSLFFNLSSENKASVQPELVRIRAEMPRKRFKMFFSIFGGMLCFFLFSCCHMFTCLYLIKERWITFKIKMEFPPIKSTIWSQ